MRWLDESIVKAVRTRGDAVFVVSGMMICGLVGLLISRI